MGFSSNPRWSLLIWHFGWISTCLKRLKRLPAHLTRKLSQKCAIMVNSGALYLLFRPQVMVKTINKNIHWYSLHIPSAWWYMKHLPHQSTIFHSFATSTHWVIDQFSVCSTMQPRHGCYPTQIYVCSIQKPTIPQGSDQCWVCGDLNSLNDQFIAEWAGEWILKSVSIWLSYGRNFVG